MFYILHPGVVLYESLPNSLNQREKVMCLFLALPLEGEQIYMSASLGCFIKKSLIIFEIVALTFASNLLEDSCKVFKQSNPKEDIFISSPCSFMRKNSVK